MTPPNSTRTPKAPATRHLRIVVLGAFEVFDGNVSLVLTGGAQRLLAFMALRDRVVRRLTAAATLWPDASEQHGLASLRSSLTRLDAVARGAIDVNGLELRLENTVTVDLRESRVLANRVLRGDHVPTTAGSTAAIVAALSLDILPDWYDDWTMGEAGEWHQLRLRALTALADQLAGQSRFEEATHAALAALEAEPLREATHATLVHIQVAQGHQVEAAAVVARYGILLREAGGIDPPPSLRELLNMQPFVPQHASGSPQGAGAPSRTNVLRRARTAVAGEETAAFEIVATGLSMEPTIHHGDTLLVAHDLTPTPGRIVVATHDGVWIVKRVAERAGQLILRSDNADEEVDLAAVTVQGVVVELHRTV